MLNGVSYAMGYTLDDSAAEELAEEAVALAAKSDAAVIFAGLPDAYESEGYDRRHMRLPEQQNHLIERVSRVQPNLVIVLHNGSPVEMPWEKQAKAILEMYLGGEAWERPQLTCCLARRTPAASWRKLFRSAWRIIPLISIFRGTEIRCAIKRGFLLATGITTAKNGGALSLWPRPFLHDL